MLGLTEGRWGSGPSTKCGTGIDGIPISCEAPAGGGKNDGAGMDVVSGVLDLGGDVGLFAKAGEGGPVGGLPGPVDDRFGREDEVGSGPAPPGMCG